jgi:hypothetical protein
MEEQQRLSASTSLPEFVFPWTAGRDPDPDGVGTERNAHRTVGEFFVPAV